MKLFALLALSLAVSTAFANGRCQRMGDTPPSGCEAQNATFVPILAYHRITDNFVSGETVIKPARFKEHLDMLEREGYTTVTISDVVAYSKGEIKLPEKSVAITFDDGWHDQLVAARMMSSRNMAATFYVTSGHFDNTEYMSREDIIYLSRNNRFEIGTHSHSHFPTWAINRQLPLSTMVGEMLMSTKIISEITGKPVKHYAWPYGYATRESVQHAERFGFASTAMINDETRNGVGKRTLELSRLNINGNCRSKHVLAMIKTGDLLPCDK
jgi:peptidoglycan/xylan/chitin deacetylase (PgdA/CDA1 family)